MRDYDKEAKDHPEHKYAYNFDLIMHGFMMRTFAMFNPAGRALEMGCYHGHFTKLIEESFSDITVIEASKECIEIASKNVGPGVRFLNSTFEKAEITGRFDTVFLIHTLEHVDERVSLLQKVDSWLSVDGRLFVATPNASAPSRQIAVKMGLISHSSAVTAPEKAQGHVITYSLDTLERDARDAGLNVITRGGIFFKGLANFQLDEALETGLISEAYLEGCYQLGMIYPDLCSSIFLVCTKGTRS